MLKGNLIRRLAVNSVHANARARSRSEPVKSDGICIIRCRCRAFAHPGWESTGTILRCVNVHMYVYVCGYYGLILLSYSREPEELQRSTFARSPDANCQGVKGEGGKFLSNCIYKIPKKQGAIDFLSLSLSFPIYCIAYMFNTIPYNVNHVVT